VSSETAGDDGTQLFGQPVTSITGGGSITADLRRAIEYPRTMSTSVLLRGGISFAASLVYIGIPLVHGYLLTATRDAADDEPAPTFDDWLRMTGRGIGLVALATAFLFGSLVVAALFMALSGAEEISDPAAAVLVLWFGYAWPWVVAVYAIQSWRGFLRGASWQWLVSSNYVLTVAVSTVLAIAGYLLTAISVISIVGWPFVGFGTMAVYSVFVGQRYQSWLDHGGDTAAPFEAATDTIRPALSALGTDQGSQAATTPPTSSDGGATDDAAEETRDDQFPDRARTVETDGPIAMVQTEDGQRGLVLETDDPDAQAAFEQCVQTWQSLDETPEVATVTVTGSEPRPWVAFDCDDGLLTAVGGDLADGAVSAIVNDVTEAVAVGRMYNHVHGDLTPECVCIRREGGTASARQRVSGTVAEWGIRRAVRNVTDNSVQTPYAPPELADGGGADTAVDVYQVAAIAHYALTGTPPATDGQWTPPNDETLPDSVVETLRRGLAPDPAQRHDSVESFAGDLETALS